VLAYFLLDEALLPAQWIGGLVVLLGIYLIHRSRQTSSREAESKAQGDLGVETKEQEFGGVR